MTRPSVIALRSSNDDDVCSPVEGGLGASWPGPALCASVLLVEEYGLVRRGIRLLLESDGRHEICGGVSSPAEAVAGSLEPDLVISELLFRDIQGPPVVAQLRDAFPTASILVLTRVGHPAYVHLALRAGASGYILKGFTRHRRPESFTMLTRREEEVVELLALGHTNSEIAGILAVALRTVEAHRSHVMQKLGLTTRAEIVRHVSERARVGA